MRQVAGHTMSVKIATPTKDDIFRTASNDTCTGRLSDNVFTGHSSKSFEKRLENEISAVVNAASKKNSRDMERPSPDQRSNLPLTKKRRSVDKVGSSSRTQRKRSFRHDRPKHGKDVIKLPTKFLLGGNINDPLNLNSMNDEAINKILNAETPVSSPLPTPAHRKQVEVLIPPNINDPLNLNSGEDLDFDFFATKRTSAKKRKKHKRKKSLANESANVESNADIESGNADLKDFSKPLSVDITENSKGSAEHTLSLNSKLKRVVDKIVSPAIPQNSPKPRRKRTISDCSRKYEGDGVTDSKQPRKDEGHKFRKQSSCSSVKAKQDKPKFRNRDDKFIYGNYDRYYGKRNAQDEDERLDCFQNDWFHNKDVLDIGCNIGHITISIAKSFEPRKIVGMDIDGKLVSIARKIVKHYLSRNAMEKKNVPVSLPLTYGPLAATTVPEKDSVPSFPNNVSFVQGNYVLERDELLDLQKEEYDVILALSITKWLHLNFGDDGLKRCFKRIFRQLRPGGKLILEPQSFASYKKKKKLNATTFENYKAIELRPERFTKYLLSSEVGFSKCDRIETPFNKSKGFQRPMYVYSKSESVGATPDIAIESRGVTPLMNIECSLTPAFDSSTTPTHDSYSFPSDYSRTPGRHFGSLWEARSDTATYSTAHTPTQASVTDSHASAGQCVAEAVHGSAPPSDVCSPGHVTFSSLCSPSHVAPSAVCSPGHVTPSGECSPSHMTPTAACSPGHVTPSGSQSSSSTCDTCGDTCNSDCSQHSFNSVQTTGDPE